MIAVADSSFVIAVANENERSYGRCWEVYNRASKIYLPQSTLNEVSYFLTKEGGNWATARFLYDLPELKYDLIELRPQDIKRTADILEKYADSRVDFVDATVAAIAERLQIKTILTLDRRDFRLIRPTHVDFFEILPD